MTPMRLLSEANRVQQTRLFKIIASAIVAVASLGSAGYFLLSSARGEAPIELGESAADQVSTMTERAIEMMLTSGQSQTGPAVAVLLAGLVGVAVVWLGLGLTYLGLLLAAVAIVGPLSALGGYEDLTLLIGGVIVLTAAFTALMQGLRAVLSGAHPVLAVARNVLAEAVRMKLSLVFIVLLVIGLSALPTLLDEGEELRFRVQSFLQYGTGGAFWIIALLTMLLSVATVSFEHRDKLIWQTMTKPVPTWQYLLGKWVGVVSLAAVLLVVCTSGVFLMTDYLRQQTALGEVRPYVSGDENLLITEDRLVLESQVLTARRSIEPDPPFAMDDPDFLEGVETYIREQRVRDESFARTDEQYAEVVSDLYKGMLQYGRELPAQQFREFVFGGLEAARASDRPLTLAYKIQTATNNPTHYFVLAFEFEGERLFPHTTKAPLDTTLTLTVPNEAVGEDGTMIMRVGVIGAENVNEPVLVSFAPDGLKLNYSAGSFEGNFLRVVFVLWIKLATLSMLGIWCSTFLSFPVACLVGFSVFLSAEASGYLSESLEAFGTTDRQGNLLIGKWVINGIGSAVTGVFSVYSGLRPTGRLVEGRLLSWGDVAVGTTVLSVIAAAFYAMGVAIFRKRELAIYSGN